MYLFFINSTIYHSFIIHYTYLFIPYFCFIFSLFLFVLTKVKTLFFVIDSISAMAMKMNASDGLQLDGEADELVLKDEISGSDDGSDSSSSSIQVLDDENDDQDNATDQRQQQRMRNNKKNCRQNQPKLEMDNDADEDNDKNGTAWSLETGELPFDSFMVDTEAVEDEADNSAYQPEDGLSAHFSFSQVISHFTPKDMKRNDGPRRNAAGKACFNCGATGHELYKCPEPRDARRISQNRNLFVGRRRESGGGARFHEQRQGPQPGVVSDTLREALGISQRELPPWIYRMRKLGLINGYPPSYRNSAAERLTVKFHMEEDMTSTVGHRRKRKHGETGGEDDQRQIKSEKLIRYPGFNFADDNFVDNDTHHWVIPPWDKFVHAQQHHVDVRRRQQRAEEGESTANKRKKTSLVIDETEEVTVLGEKGTKEMSGEQKNGVDEANSDEEEKEEDVLFVDASRAKKRRKANATLEEGEILDDDEMETEQHKTASEASSAAPVAAPSLPLAAFKRPKAPITQAEQQKTLDGIDLQKIQLGTPVPSSYNFCAEKPDYAVEKPALEKWSIGIQAFQHQPPAASTGFFKRMHQIVKSVRKNGGDAKNRKNNEVDQNANEKMH